MRRCPRILKILLAMAIAIALPVLAQPAESTCGLTYYVSPKGNDTASGRSLQQAWKTIARVNQVTFTPGDCLRFEGGAVFRGSLYFDSADRGTPTRPIQIGSYGTGRAKLIADRHDAIFAYNTAGFEIQDLILQGNGDSRQRTNGISFYTDLAGNVKLPYLKIRRVEAAQFGSSGIAIGSKNEAAPYTGFTQVTLDQIDAHDNGDAGIMSYGTTPAKAIQRTRYPHSRFVLTRSRLYSNKGIPTKTTTHSGSGAVFGQVEGLRIEHNEAFDNGSLSQGPTGGPTGLWAYECKDVVMQFNESHHNHRGQARADGGGFDLDGGSVNGVVQFNYSHHNEGPGFLIAQYVNAAPLRNVTVQYNISANDGLRADAGLAIWSHVDNPFGIQNAYFLHNTVRVDAGATQVVKIQDGLMRNVRFANNILMAQSTSQSQQATRFVVANQPFPQVNFYGNYYWNSDQSFRVLWNGVAYSSLQAWRSLGQEQWAGTATGKNIDPQIQNSIPAIAKGNFSSLSSAYSLPQGSPARAAGLNLQSTLGIQSAARDFFGRPVNRSSPSVGAVQ